MPDDPSQQYSSSLGNRQSLTGLGSMQPELDHSLGRSRNKNVLNAKRSNESSRPDVIQEVSEPTTPDSHFTAQPSPPSALSDMLRKSPAFEEETRGLDEESLCGGNGVQPVVVGEGIISQPNEETTLLLKKAASGLDDGETSKYGSVRDVEGQRLPRGSVSARFRNAIDHKMEAGARICRTISSPKSWDMRDVWVHCVRQPASYIPSVILGLLLNILDALSYGERLCSWNRSIGLTLYRHDLVSPRPADIREFGSRRNLNILRKLHCVTASIFFRW